MWGVEPARWFRLVQHLWAYGGAVAAVVSVTRTQAEGDVPVAATPAPAMPQPGVPAPAGARTIGATAAELRMSDIGDLFSVGSSGG